MDQPSKCLIIEPHDWHTMHHFTPDAVLLVLASEPFDPKTIYTSHINDRLRKSPKSKRTIL